MTDDLERAIGPDRRTFVKRLIIGSAFATPVVSSFTMTGVHAVFGDAPSSTITGISNANTVVPPADCNEELVCDDVGPAGGSLDADDGAVHVNVVIPPGAFPSVRLICLFKGDLAAMASQVPSGETPLSAYGVAWGIGDDAALPLVMTVTGAPVSVGDPVYMFDKDTGDPAQVGSVVVAGTWQVTFTEDPCFVVTEVPAGAAPAAPPAAVAAQPTTTG